MIAGFTVSIGSGYPREGGFGGEKRSEKRLIGVGSGDLPTPSCDVAALLPEGVELARADLGAGAALSAVGLAAVNFEAGSGAGKG